MLVGCYWAILGFVGIRLCLLVARIGRIAIMASTRRMHFALLFIGAGLTLAAAQVLVPLQSGTVVLAGGLTVLAVAVLIVGVDLRRIPLLWTRRDRWSKPLKPLSENWGSNSGTWSLL